MDGELTIATSTDSAAVAQAAADGNEKGARVPQPESGSKELDGSSAVSFEHPRSERTMLLERLVQEHEKKFEDVAEPERVTSNEVPESEPGEGEAGEAGSKQTSDAGNPLEQFGITADHPHLKRLAEAESWYGRAGMEQIGQRFYGLPPVAPGIMRAFADCENSVDMLIELAQHPRPDIVVGVLNSLPKDRAESMLREISANLAARGSGNGNGSAETQAGVRSKAPPPIRPVRASSTTSSLPADQLPYQDFKRIREQQIKQRGRGR